MPAATGLSLRSKLLIAGTASLIGVVLGATVFGPGAASAQEATPTTTELPSNDRQGPGRLRTALEPLVADGTITSAQADAVAAHLVQSFPGHRLRRFHASLDVAAATIGITEAELFSALRESQTVAEVAEDNGVTPQTVIDALVSDINSRVDEALAAGTIDSEQAAEIKTNAVERATGWVNGDFGGWPGGGFFGGGPEEGEAPETGA